MSAPVDELLDLAATPEEWALLRTCAICGQAISKDAPARRGYYIRGDGLALFRTHPACGDKARRDSNVQRELVNEASTTMTLGLGEPGGRA
jgi:hypothetical protein